MDHEMKAGIIFVVIAFGIPLMTFPFLSGYAKDKNILDNLYLVGIEINKSNQGDGINQSSGNIEKTQRKTSDYSRFIPHRIPLRLFLVFTVIFLYMGVVRIDASMRKKKGSYENPPSPPFAKGG
jgi:hypothetical protein